MRNEKVWWQRAVGKGGGGDREKQRKTQINRENIE